jgi:hypothetical protein
MFTSSDPAHGQGYMKNESPETAFAISGLSDFKIRKDPQVPCGSELDRTLRLRWVLDEVKNRSFTDSRFASGQAGMRRSERLTPGVDL